MSELLLELFSEEIPAMMQKKAEESYHKIFTKYFADLQLNFEFLEVNIGPRRIAIYVKGLPQIIPATSEEIKGPAISAPDNAIEGFCRSNNVTKDDLIIKEVKGKEFYFYEQKIAEKTTENILLETLPTPISEYVWPKSMYWGDYKIKWVRPLQNILCIFDGKIIPFNYGHLQANNLCYGHRFMNPGPQEITNYEQYKQYLADSYVVLETSKRKEIIEANIAKIEKELGLVIKEDDSLLEEVVGLTEYPRVLVGKIEEKFLSVPSEILVSAMRSHQKYFSVFDKNGEFAPYFIFVSNIKSSSEELIISGNEKVLSARLSDALYFYNQDLKTTLSDKAQRLDKVIFHAKLGSLGDKVKRLEELCQFIKPDEADLQIAARLCKSDIVSETVDEFTSLQGVMGYYFALAEGQNQQIAEALRDHYKPQGANDGCPTGLSAWLSIADKIDSLCGLMVAGEKPSGSKDPYALRRSALAIIRIIIENKLDIDLLALIRHSLELYGQQLGEDYLEKIDNVEEMVLQFLEERVKFFFKANYSPQLISAALDLRFDPNLLNFTGKIEALEKFLTSPEGENLLQSYKRINNILGTNQVENSVNESLFVSEYERALFAAIKDQKKPIYLALERRDYKRCLELLGKLCKPLSEFFEHIMVKDKNMELANNRMALLQEMRNIFNQIAKFDKV